MEPLFLFILSMVTFSTWLVEIMKFDASSLISIFSVYDILLPFPAKHLNCSQFSRYLLCKQQLFLFLVCLTLSIIDLLFFPFVDLY